MILEERNYLLVPGGITRYLDLWNQFGHAAQTAHLGQPVGVYTIEIGTLNTLVYLWQFTDLADRSTRRLALAADSDFAAFRAQVRELLVTQSNRILTPAPNTQIGTTA